MLRALLYAYVLGGVTFVPLLLFVALFITFYTSVPVRETETNSRSEQDNRLDGKEPQENVVAESEATVVQAANDLPRTRKGWLTVRRSFQETASDGSYVTLVRSFLDSRSKDPKRSRPKDMWYVVLKGTVLYLYEDEEMTECGAAIELSRHQVLVYPERLLDAELFAKRNAICLRPKLSDRSRVPSLSRKMRMQSENIHDTSSTDTSKEDLAEDGIQGKAATEQAMNSATPCFIFVRSNVEMEDWYHALIHASEHPAQTPTLSPLHDIFDSLDMNHLVSTLDEQPDVIPMRWLNALLGRIFFSHYRTQALESYIIGRLMKKLSKVKIPAFLTEVAVTNVSVGKRAPMFSKPMLKELTKEGDASIEVHLQYRGEVRITVEATAVINLGARFKSYTVKLVLAAVLRELEGNLLIKVKRPPSNRIWYAFTQTPRIVMEVEPIVSDRQITWGMILSTIESKFKEIIQESVVMPNMDDIAFFDTEPYERRGGIWSDAGRKSLMPSSTTILNHEESSLPLISMDTTPSPSETALKGDNVSIQSAPGALPLPSETPSSTNLDDSLDPSRTPTRRRTWFSSTTNEEMDVSTSHFVPGSHSDKLDIQNHIQESEMSSVSHTVVSPRQPQASPVVDDSMEKTYKRELALITGQPTPSRRSVSQYSIEVPQSILDHEIDKSSIPRKNSDASASGQPSSPPSFFNSLKARTADKQAIKETAKEAIRKWGVNWGGFRKDISASGAGQGDDSSETDAKRSTLEGDGGGKTATHKSRTSYAEVRAAVAERKGREKTPQRLDQGPEPSNESSLETTRSRTHATPVSPDAVSTSPETSGTAALARLPSPSITEKSSFSRLNTEQDVKHQDGLSEEHTKPTPIHVQPVAKTMSIPGIHVSHRGEVQSLGYVAPQTQPLASSGPMSEAMLKNPAIQSVYRFLKPNGDRKEDSSELLAHNQSHHSYSRPSSSVSPNDDQTDHTEGLIPPAVTSQPKPKPIPPPLPPRSTSAAQHEPCPLPSGSDSTENDGRIQIVDHNSTSDLTSRGFVQHETRTEDPEFFKAVEPGNGTPPPLPPRRTPVLDVTNDQ